MSDHRSIRNYRHSLTWSLGKPGNDIRYIASMSAVFGRQAFVADVATRQGSELIDANNQEEGAQDQWR